MTPEIPPKWLAERIGAAIQNAAQVNRWGYKHGYRNAAVLRLGSELLIYAAMRLSHVWGPIEQDELNFVALEIDRRERSLGKTGRRPRIEPQEWSDLLAAYTASLLPDDPADLMFGVVADDGDAPIHADDIAAQ